MNAMLICSVLLLLVATEASIYQIDQRSCRINEVYSPCSQMCPPTCENPNPRCRVDCHRPSCNCAPGYVNSGGNCIQANSCFQHLPVSARCRTTLDCRQGANCNNGFCATASGVYTRTHVSSSSSSSFQNQHQQRSHSIRNGCVRDFHCGQGYICINGYCVVG
uniref:TIL domain-containing protein n=1 Tax=Caenorhabditis japonica TaxID=281687 RepID=A0A8R1I3A1_CAEJA